MVHLWEVRRIRDQSLLDTLESLDREPYEGTVWRSVREGRDPIACWRSGGRWDDGTFDVLYTSDSPATAIVERRFHLYQGQPFAPSKIRCELYELRISLESVVHFANVAELAAIGIDPDTYGRLAYTARMSEYARSQEIAEAYAFLGADGLLVPSARDWSSNNLIVLCEQDTDIRIEVARNHGIVVIK